MDGEETDAGIPIRANSLLQIGSMFGILLAIGGIQYLSSPSLEQRTITRGYGQKSAVLTRNDSSRPWKLEVINNSGNVVATCLYDDATNIELSNPVSAGLGKLIYSRDVFEVAPRLSTTKANFQLATQYCMNGFH